ncbi:hypothetical protein VTN77DRAFT_2107 [Rasamsonia byssochlamydoides]|uniref:uncharacterized protein n=1 Tax=Rasamsonia byssochlamydoides TaxID=89139 RepID=UPI00374297F8
MSGERPGLTEGALALHNQNSAKDSNAPNSWAAKVVTEERIHLYYCQLGQSQIDCGDHTANGIDGLTPAPHGQPERHLDYMESRSQSTADAHLKIFQQRPLHTSPPEGPLERFLTPDGCSDPSYYARPALEKTQIAFGSMETVDERRSRARGNVEMVIQKKKEKKKYEG